MKKRIASSFVFGSCLLISSIFASSNAIAGSDYTSDQIADFLVKSADMGAARGICVGTVDECSSKPTKPAGFDMLVNFEHDSATLTKAAQTNLEQIAKALNDQRLSAAKFVVEGHTDASGAEPYNLGLSERRAQSVTSFLLGKGLSSEKITALGLGEREPRTENGRDAANRRVEIRIDLQ